MADTFYQDIPDLFSRQVPILGAYYQSDPKTLRIIRAAMAGSGPTDQYGNPTGGSGYGSGQSDSGRSPLAMSLGFLKNLTEKKGTRVDGQPLKRRGPKPDAKPALTRRQELNRQAQRTHRERKELYIKALEQEVLRLKENFSTVTATKDALFDENQRLKHLLAQHGIPWTGTGGVDELLRNGSTTYPSSGSTGSYGNSASGFSPPPPNSSTTTPSPGLGGVARPGIDYDQQGIDFVLTYDPARALERPCMDHMQYLVERASSPEGEPCGHALMASCPPEPHPSSNIPFGHGIGNLANVPESQGQKTWDLKVGDLANLLDLSKRLNLDGEITPVMAWGMVLAHPRVGELEERDFGKVVAELKDKIRCYGFGAVLEEFEVRDALENVFSTKGF